jgi:NAD(P)H-nitrite reductase large subunit
VAATGAATATTGASLPNVAVTLAEMGAKVMTGDEVAEGDGERDDKGVRDTGGVIELDAVGDGVRVAVGVAEACGTAVMEGVEAGTAKPHMWVSPAVTRDQPL